MTKLPQVELDCEGGEEALIIKTSSRRAEGDWKVVVHNTLNQGCVGRSCLLKILQKITRPRLIFFITYVSNLKFNYTYIFNSNFRLKCHVKIPMWNQMHQQKISCLMNFSFPSLLLT